MAFSILIILAALACVGILVVGVIGAIVYFASKGDGKPTE